MSTHINGVLLKSLSSLADFATWKEEVSSRLEPLARQCVLETLTKTAVDILDETCLSFGGFNSLSSIAEYELSPIEWAYRKIEKEREETRKGIRHDDVDTECAMMVFPAPENASEGIPALIFCGNPVLEKTLRSSEIVTDYSYYNGTDGPDNVSPEAWSARQDYWDRVIPSGVPSHHGFHVSLVSPDLPVSRPTLEDMSRLLTTTTSVNLDLEFRIKRWSRRLAADLWYEESLDLKNNKPSIGEYVRIISRMDDSHSFYRRVEPKVRSHLMVSCDVPAALFRSLEGLKSIPSRHKP